jgi:nucleoside-diphosphate-sugar epimerase
MPKRDKLLVTGATGFIGSNVARYFLKRGFDVDVFVRKGSDTWRIRDIRRDLSVRVVDLTDKTTVRRTVSRSKPDVIVHAASYGGNRGQTETDAIFRANDLGTRHLYEACRDHGFKIFINTGTSSEYGVKSTPMKESDALCPVADYGVSKAAATLFLKELAKREKRCIVTLRLFSPYGYFEAAERLVPSVILSCLKGRAPLVSAPGNVRDFVFIEDVLDAYGKAVKNRNKISGEVFNIGQGQQHSVAEVVGCVARLTGLKAAPRWGQAKSRVLEPERWQADIRKAKKLLDWKPRHTLTEGLKKSVSWFKDNLELYRGQDESF